MNWNIELHIALEKAIHLPNTFCNKMLNSYWSDFSYFLMSAIQICETVYHSTGFLSLNTFQLCHRLELLYFFEHAEERQINPAVTSVLGESHSVYSSALHQLTDNNCWTLVSQYRACVESNCYIQPNIYISIKCSSSQCFSTFMV